MIQIKTAKELDLMRTANAMSAAALKYAGEQIEPGMSTYELDQRIEKYIVKSGGVPNFKGLYGFPGSACISVNDTVIHGLPSKKDIIHPGDIVSIDTGVKIGGFNGDNACTFVCGEIPATTQRLLDVTKEALHLGIAKALVGNRVGDISNAIQMHCEANGFSVVREFIGHGVGKELHEDPEVPNFGKAGRGPRLAAGMVIAIEPMICEKDRNVKTLSDGWTVKTQDGGMAAHFEHTIAILPSGPEILTRGWEEARFAK